jgi:hypothetical protein
MRLAVNFLTRMTRMEALLILESQFAITIEAISRQAPTSPVKWKPWKHVSLCLLRQRKLVSLCLFLQGFHIAAFARAVKAVLGLQSE